MRKLRWVSDGELWDVDMSTARTVEGNARGVPLGLSRGSRLSRPKQIDFMQRFMYAPFLPSFSPLNGFSLHRVLTIPFTTDSCFASLLGQFHLFKFLSKVKEQRNSSTSSSEWLHTFKQQLRDKTLYALSFSSEILLTPDDNLLVSFEGYGDPQAPPRQKAVFHHKFSRHNLTVEAVSPGLFVDKGGNYWDVPLSTSVDLASLPSDSGTSYHLSMHHNAGDPKLFQADETRTSEVPAILLPGFFITSAFAYKHNVDIWRGKDPKLKLVQPYDIFLSNPHISASGTIGAIAITSHGDNSDKLLTEDQDDSKGLKGIRLHAPVIKSALQADLFASLSFTAQHGNFQRLFLDLTRFHAHLDFPSGSKFLSGATRLAQDYFNSQQPNLEALQAICPNATISIQQQIAGPFSFRVDSGFAIDLKKRDFPIRMNKPLFAMEYALQVLGSAKAVAWYSPKHQEFMVELRFFER